MAVSEELVAANERYAASFRKGDLPAAPARRFAVVTCMDARIDPAKSLGLKEGDAHVIRNAGGIVTEDALRSLIISHWELGTEEAVVIGHTRCGMATFTNEEMRRKLADRARVDASGVDFLPFTSVDESVRSSVSRIRNSPLLPGTFGASGFVYDVGTGRLRRVA
jgi:carbonic anhydrase